MLVYKFISQEWGLETLKTKKVKVSDFEELNDPFELLSMSLEDRHQRNRLKNKKTEFSKKFGLICFSKNWRNPVMWSHYADSHKGIALEFDIPCTELKEITYKPVRETDLNAPFEKIASIKFSHRRYEAEIRKFVPLNGRADKTFLDFGNSLQLQKVILEPDYDPIDIPCSRKLQRRREENGVQFITSRLAFKSFQVVHQRNKKQWKKL